MEALYAQYTFCIDDNDNTASTNYRSESFRRIPVNSQVRFLFRGSRGRQQMRVIDGVAYTYQHIKKHTEDSFEEAFGKAFGPEPVDLSGFTEQERKAIQEGRVEVGMSREAVLIAMGPPPAVGTPSLDADTWKYWSNRFRTFFVTFENDRVSHAGQ